MTHGSRLLLASLLPVAAAAQVVAPARGAADLSGLSRDLQALSERVKPAVVQVLITGYAAADGQLVKQRASGSGVILDPDGYVITNAHVVRGARRVQVALAGLASGPPGARSILKAPGRVVGAVVVGTDLETDLALALASPGDLAALGASRVPLGRLGRPDEIGRASCRERV